MIKKWILITIILFLIGFTGCTDNTDLKLSGTLKEGLRWITLDKSSKSLTLQVYRGDYVRFAMKDNSTALFEIPEMDINISLPMVDTAIPYIKFKETGVFPFTVNGRAGTITVHEYERQHYTAITANEALELLKKDDLVILDVRTPGEYKSGHIQDAVLIPVQELQRRFDELADYKDRPILIYCATGNRSTVASKILQDRGFKEIYNLRYGIKGWIRDGNDVVQ